MNRVCIAKGPEGCPACIASLHSVRETDSFATIPKELEEVFGSIEEVVLGMCIITSKQIAIGDKCNVENQKFTDFVTK